LFSVDTITVSMPPRSQSPRTAKEIYTQLLKKMKKDRKERKCVSPHPKAHIHYNDNHGLAGSHYLEH
jgi:hypothetical protein